MVSVWKDSLGKTSEKAAQSLADPIQYENLFPDYATSVAAEKYIQAERGQKIPAHAYSKLPVIEL